MPWRLLALTPLPFPSLARHFRPPNKWFWPFFDEFTTAGTKACIYGADAHFNI